MEYPTQKAIALTVGLALFGAGCSGNNIKNYQNSSESGKTPKELAIGELEKVLSVNPGSNTYYVKDGDSTRVGNIHGRVLTDSTYTLKYSNGEIDTLKMSIEVLPGTKPISNGTEPRGNIYRFRLFDGLPSLVDIEIYPDGKTEVLRILH